MITEVIYGGRDRGEVLLRFPSGLAVSKARVTWPPAAGQIQGKRLDRNPCAFLQPVGFLTNLTSSVLNTTNRLRYRLSGSPVVPRDRKLRTWFTLSSSIQNFRINPEAP